jgi:DNA-directed RNA polymerase subunit H (RpoH/RPB5)
MHYLMPKHEILSPAESQVALQEHSLKIEEIPSLIYQDAALKYLRRQGIETPLGAIVRIIVVRGRFGEGDSLDPADRTKTKFRVVAGV